MTPHFSDFPLTQMNIKLRKFQVQWSAHSKANIYNLPNHKFIITSVHQKCVKNSTLLLIEADFDSLACCFSVYFFLYTPHLQTRGVRCSQISLYYLLISITSCFTSSKINEKITRIIIFFIT
jgi:hypothetical protein